MYMITLIIGRSAKCNCTKLNATKDGRGLGSDSLKDFKNKDLSVVRPGGRDGLLRLDSELKKNTKNIHNSVL